MESKKLMAKTLRNGWLKQFYTPCDLSRGEQAIFSYVAQYEHLRDYDNAIVGRDGEPIKAKELLERCTLKYDSNGREIIAGLKKRGIIVKSKGVLFLNPYMAYKGKSVLDSTLKLFEYFRYGEEEVETALEGNAPYEEVPEVVEPLEEIPLEELPF